MLEAPLRQLLPLVARLPVDGQAELRILILGLFEVAGDFLDDVREVFAVDVVVGLEEDLAEAGLADRVVLGVELVEAMERVAVLKKSFISMVPTKFPSLLTA